MAVQANLVINDGQITPVAHTFNPKGVLRLDNKKQSALWRDQTPTNAEGYLSITEQHADPNGNGIEKFRYVFDVPTLETPGGTGPFVPPPTRAYGTMAVVEYWVHKRATQQELKDIVAYVKNFTALTYVSDAITKREAAW